MSKSSTAKVGSQGTMLPLEEWIAGEAARRAPDREPRQIGSIVAEIVEKAGQRRREVGGSAPGHTDREGGRNTTRSETGGKGTPTEAGASFAGAIKHRGEPVNNCDVLPRTILDRRPNTGDLVAVVYVFERMPSEDHHASSETWIEF